MQRIAFLCALLAACDCSSDPTRPTALCADEEPPAECGTRCSITRPCPDGFFCNAAECDVECIDSETCAEGYECGDNGLCTVAPIPFDATGYDGPSPDGSVCAHQEVAAGRVTPHVIIVIDQSGSMDEDFGDSNRWDSLRDSLLAEPDGFIYALQDQVIFGLALFSGDEGGMCPILTTVPSALNNYTAIADVYNDEEVRNETPTGDSMNELLDDLLGAPDRNDNPTIFILATDGEPDTCAEPNPQNGQPQALAAVERAYENGIRTYIISVGREISEEHLSDMANAGLGRSSGPDAEFWVAGDDEGLRDALGEIIGGALSCTIELDGRIDVTAACAGRVELNGNPIPCNDPDGWVAVDESHVELQGEACDRLTMNMNATLRASFPCDVLII